MTPPTAQQLAEHKLMTVQEVAEYMRITPRTVTNLAARGSIPGTQMGKLWRFSRERITSIVAPREAPHNRSELVSERGIKPCHDYLIRYVTQALRSRYSSALNSRNVIKTTSVLSLVGCSIPELMSYLEARFAPNMSWDNRGEWHIDHIRPCHSFDLTKLEELQICFHYSNLQPLWARDNLSKSKIY